MGSPTFHAPLATTLALGTLDWVDAHVWSILFWLCLASTVVAWWGWQRDQGRWIIVGASGFLGAAMALVASWMTVTPAEHGERVVLRLVASAVDGNASAMMDGLAPDVTWHRGTTESHAEPQARVVRAIERIATTDRISSNTVTMLDGESIDADTAHVSLACLTQTQRSMGLVATRWEFDVTRSPDGRWLIHRIVWARLMGQEPGPGHL